MLQDPNRVKHINEGIKSTIPDVFFVFLPLIVIFIVSAVRNELGGIFSQAEWSFAAAVLSGQSIVKIVIALSARSASVELVKESRTYAIAIAAVIVFLLVPSLTILIFMLITDPIAQALVDTQIVLFVLSLVAYIYSGITAENMLNRD